MFNSPELAFQVFDLVKGTLQRLINSQALCCYSMVEDDLSATISDDCDDDRPIRFVLTLNFDDESGNGVIRINGDVVQDYETLFNFVVDFSQSLY